MAKSALSTAASCAGKRASRREGSKNCRVARIVSHAVTPPAHTITTIAAPAIRLRRSVNLNRDRHVRKALLLPQFHIPGELLHHLAEARDGQRLRSVADCLFRTR